MPVAVREGVWSCDAELGWWAPARAQALHDGGWNGLAGTGEADAEPDSTRFSEQHIPASCADLKESREGDRVCGNYGRKPGL